MHHRVEPETEEGQHRGAHRLFAGQEDPARAHLRPLPRAPFRRRRCRQIAERINGVGHGRHDARALLVRAGVDQCLSGRSFEPLLERSTRQVEQFDQRRRLARLGNLEQAQIEHSAGAPEKRRRADVGLTRRIGEQRFGLRFSVGLGVSGTQLQPRRPPWATIIERIEHNVAALRPKEFTQIFAVRVEHHAHFLPRRNLPQDPAYQVRFARPALARHRDMLRLERARQRNAAEFETIAAQLPA